MNASRVIGELHVLLNDEDLNKLERGEKLKDDLIYIVENNTYKPFWIWTTEDDSWIAKKISRNQYRAAFPKQYLPLIRAGRMIHQEGWQGEIKMRKVRIGKEGVIY